MRASDTGVVSNATDAEGPRTSKRIWTRFKFHSTGIEPPVRLPPGLARLATRPAATGSPTARNTIGIVVVAFFRASAPTKPLVA